MDGDKEGVNGVIHNTGTLPKEGTVVFRSNPYGLCNAEI